MLPPANLKKIAPFVRRAAEIERTGDVTAPVVSYFCRQQAIQMGLKMQKGPEDQKYLGLLMTLLEEDKKRYPVLEDKSKCETIVRNYAMEVMTVAEDEYMSERANMNTARKFSASACFFETLAAFQDDGKLNEFDKKQCLFAKFRATNIIKAIKEGRDPVPTADERKALQDAEMQEREEEELVKAQIDKDVKRKSSRKSLSGLVKRFSKPRRYGGGASQANMAPVATGARGKALEQTRAAFKAVQAENYPAAVGSLVNALKELGDPGMDAQARDKVTATQKDDTLELCRFAIKALESDDIPVACSHLESALHELA
jgi:hypothetical protein